LRRSQACCRAKERDADALTGRYLSINDDLATLVQQAEVITSRNRYTLRRRF
jgi:hypothetical protein